MDLDDELVTSIPIRFSNALSPTIQIHQFPLLTRPLQAPPSAAASGKRITARIKPDVRRLEIHVPSDTRSEVWNNDRGRELGAARVDDDREKNQEIKSKHENDEPRLNEVRMRSEQIQQKGSHMLGIVRDGQLHLHPISETHQLRPTLTYLDILSRKKRSRGVGSDSDSDDGPPPDPDDPVPAAPAPKKEKKSSGEAREVQVTARRAEDKGLQAAGGLSVARREMLIAIRAEEDEEWQDLEFCDVTTGESEETFERIFSTNEEVLESKTDVTAFLKDIAGL
ncbi:DNA-directed RNA polymerase III subunit Rpc5 [Roridomyces roridus]|uniref:DNA-directed RNA polymerase III subunit Rpc5 n=1 Tax=Roridomyces roridus TaxID=1738132 RepID=A0AAD7BUB6_9AGAR|nr:DNA-directed RNA polymerase III subunit Rpc5 [Roridomyces roridus]